MSEPEDLSGQAIRSIGWVVAERWSSRLVMLAVFAVLARLLGPEDFGLISIAMAFVAILQVFVDSSFSKALIQRKTLGEKDASTAFWTSLGLAVVLCVLLFVLAPLFGELFGQPRLAPILQALSFVLPITALAATPAALLEREFRFQALSIRQSVGTFVGAVVAIPAALVGLGVWALVLQMMATAVASLVALWASTDWRPKFEYSFDSLRRLWSVGLSVLGIELLDQVFGNIDKIVLGAFFGASELGYYFLAQRIGTILIELVTTVISRISLTTFSRVQDDLVRLNRIFRQLTFVAAAVAFPTFGLVAALAPQLIPFIFGPGWDAALPILWILAPGWALSAVMYFDRAVMISTGHEKSALGLALVQSAVGIGLTFALLPLGVVGVALSRWTRVVLWPIRLALLHRYIALPVWRYILQVVRCGAAVLPPTLAILLLQVTPWATVPASIWLFAAPLAVIGLAIYAVLLWWFAGEENRTILRRVGSALVSRVRRKKTDSESPDQ